MTNSRIQDWKAWFEWDRFVTAWEDRLSELADYRKIHGHCNVPWGYSENTGWLIGHDPGRIIGCTEGKTSL
jgi:hypothetical protein